MAKDPLAGRVFEMRAESADALFKWSRKAFHLSATAERGILPTRTAIRRHNLRCHLAARMLRKLRAPSQYSPASGEA